MSQENTATHTGIDKKIMALSLAFIVLAACLVGVVALFFINENNLQAQIAEKENTIDSMTNTIRQLQGELIINSDTSAYEAQISNLRSEIADLNETIKEYLQIVNLEVVESEFQNFTQDANSTTLLWDRTYRTYGGFMVLDVEATAESTFVNVVYSFANSFLFNQTYTVGKSGSAAFPVMTSVYVSITVGNENETSTNSGNVTLTYRY